MFRVEWLQSALSDLATIWIAADSATRQAITSAAQSIDDQLKADPHHQGESRPDGERILFAPPLGLLFEIDQQRSVVTVLHVWRFRRRG